jgi:hypothetical protein
MLSGCLPPALSVACFNAVHPTHAEYDLFSTLDVRAGDAGDLGFFTLALRFWLVFASILRNLRLQIEAVPEASNQTFYMHQLKTTSKW